MARYRRLLYFIIDSLLVSADTTLGQAHLCMILIIIIIIESLQEMVYMRKANQTCFITMSLCLFVSCMCVCLVEVLYPHLLVS